MKLTKYILPLVLLFVLHMRAPAQEFEYTIVDSSKLWFDGTSTLHDFTCYANEVEARVAFSPELLDGQKSDIHQGEVIIPVLQIKHKDEGLNKNMYKTLEPDKWPDIKFVWNSMQVTDSLPSNDIINATISGNLSIKGETRDITIPVEIKGVDNPDTLNVVGAYPLSLANFDIKRPTFFLGTLKVGDEIKIYFDLTFARSLYQNELTIQ